MTMKFRFLLFFILVFFLGAFSTKAQDLVYNGEVEITVNVVGLYQKDMNDNDGTGNLDCKMTFYRMYGSFESTLFGGEISGNGEERADVYTEWTNVAKKFPLQILKSRIEIEDKTLKQFSQSDDIVVFGFTARENDAGSHSDYRESAECSVGDLIRNNPTPGYHTYWLKGDGSHHWAAKLEYSITPPSVEITNPSIDDTSFEEGSIVPLKVNEPVGANFEYEWMVQIDNAVTSEKTGQKVVSYMFIDAYEGSYGPFPWASALGRALTPKEENATYPYFLFSNEEIRTLTRYCELFVIHEGDDSPLYQFYYDTLMDEYEDIPVFVPAPAGDTGINITSEPSNDYILPETDKFYQNFKFRLQTIVRTDGKDDLRCIEEDKVIIVDVFPHYPDIQPISEADKKTVRCYGGDDGEVKIKVNGDLGTNGGVVGYNVNVTNIATNNSPPDKKYYTSEFTLGGFAKGTYRISVSNLFSQADIDKYEDDPKFETFFQIGHDQIDVEIIENDQIQLVNNPLFISNGKCDQYVVDLANITAKGGLGGYKYSLDNDNISTKPRVLADALELPGYGEGKDIPLYIEDVAGCIGQGTAVLTRDLKFEFIVADENLPIISCFGETTNFQVSAQGGSGTYQFDLDKAIDDSSKSSKDELNFDVNAGSHTFYVKESHGCSSNIERTFEQNEAVEIYDFVRTKKVIGKEIHISCNGAEDGEVKFMIKGGTPPYSYTLSGPILTPKSDTDIILGAEVVIEGLKAGDYTLEVLDANNCSLVVKKEFKLIQPEPLLVTPEYADYSGFNYKCFEDFEKVKFSVKGGISPYVLSYGSEVKNISNPGDDAEFDVQGTAPIIIINDALECKPDFDLTLIEPDELTVEMIPNKYTSGTGEVYHIKKNGGNDKLDVIVEGGITPYAITFQKYDEGKGVWKLVESRSSSLRINKFDVTAGTYKAIVNGKYPTCIQENPITIKEPAPLLTSITYPDDFNSYQIKCNGETGRFNVSPSGGIKPYTLVITKPGDDVIIKTIEAGVSLLAAGSYDLKISDKFDEVHIVKSIVLNEPDPLDFTIQVDNFNGYEIECSYSKGIVTIEPDGGVLPYTIIQKFGIETGLKKDDIIGDEAFIDLKDGTYTYTVTDENGCEIDKPISLTKPDELKINFGTINIPSCHEFDMGDQSKKEDGQIELMISGGATLGYKTNILLGGELAEGYKTAIEGNSLVFNFLKKGEYEFVTIDGNGCKVEETKKLEQPDLLTIDGSKMTVTEPSCFASNDGHWESKILGGTPVDDQYSYKINGVEGKTGSTFNQKDLSAGDYKIEISDDKGCYYKLEKELKEPDLIVNQLEVLGIDILKDGGVANFDCFGSEDGSTITVNGGTANYTVQIYKGKTLFQELNEVAEGVGISAKDLGAGSYSILTTDKRGCQSDKIDFELNQPEEIEFTREEAKYIDGETNEVFDYTCFGASETIGVSVKGGHAPYQITYNGETKEISESEGYVDFNVTGTKPVFDIIDAKNCPKEYKPTLKEPLELQLELLSKHYVSDTGEDYQIKCFAGTDSIWAKATGGITPYTFELLDESNILMASKESNDEVFFEDLPTGLYHVKVTGAFNTSCSASDNISLKQPEPINSNITLSAYNGFEIECKGLTDTIKVEALGGISPYTIHLKGKGIEKDFTDVDDEQVTFSDLPAGNYQVSIADQFKACEYVKNLVLREPTALKYDIETSHYEGGFEIRCSYLKDSVRITPYGGIPITNSSKYKIVQSDEDENHQLGNIVAGEDLVFKNLNAGMYSYKVSDDNGCFVENVVMLQKPDSLQITGVDFTIPTCHEKDMGDILKRTDGEINVQVAGGVSYSGGYYDFLLNKMPLSDATDRLDSIRAISNTTFIQLETGEYIIRVIDVNACITERSKQHLEQADWLHIESFNSVIPECYEAKDGFWTSEVLGGTSASGNYSFTISKEEQAFRNGITAKAFNQDDLGKGKYLLEITDDLGCYYKEEEELLQPAEIAINFDVMGVTDFGNNDGAVQARVSGGNGDYRYQWHHKGEKYPNGELKKIEDLYAGEYTVEVWDKNNCPYGNNEFGVANGLKKTAGVIEPGSKLNIVVNPVKTSYFGAADGVLEVSAVGGWPYAVWPGYEFSLNQGAWLVTSNFENLKAGLYQLRVKDSKGVKDSIEVVIEEPEEILMELEKSNCLCFEDASGSIRVNASGGTAPYTYAIIYAIEFSKSNEFTNLKAGNYRVFVKDKLGNIQNQYIDIEEPENLNVELSDLIQSTCNSSNGSVKIGITGGTPEYYINWGDFYPTNKLQPNTLAAGDYQIEVTDANSCVASQSFLIEENSGPEISLMALKEVSCHETTDGEISIEITNGTEPYDVIWKGFGSLNTREIKQLGKGKYSLVVSDANNCFDEAEYEITGPEELEFYVSSLQSPNCVGIDDGSIQVTAIGGSPDYTYNLNDKSSNSSWFPNLGAGGLQIEVTDANACKKTLDVELSAPVPVTIELPYEYVLCQNQTETVSSGVTGASSQWFLGENKFSTDKEVELSEAGDYRLVVTTEKGCEAEHEFKISFLDYEVVADFIIPVEAIVGDTIVAVDISWEQPDSVKWHFPDGLEVVKREEASIWLRVLEAGNHTIGMSIFKNDCSDYMEKQIQVESSSTKRKAGFIQPDQVYITEAKLYPNPNMGDFHLKLLLSKVADVRLEIYDVQRALKVDTRGGQDNAVYQFDFNNRSIFRPNNVYAIVIIAGNEKRVLRFLVY